MHSHTIRLGSHSVIRIKAVFYYPRRNPFLSFIFCIWLLSVILLSLYTDIASYVGFFILGVIGAIFANATGAGGGVVFVPFFSQLNLEPETIIATSFAIQCFGMTAGSLAWLKYYHQNQAQKDWQILPKLLRVLTPVAIVSLLLTQFVFKEHAVAIQNDLHIYFGGFSVLLSIAIFLSIVMSKRTLNNCSDITMFDMGNLILVGLFGGCITACLSVGVGELIAVYLILRGFNARLSIAVAVMVSALCVLFGAVYYLFVMPSVYWKIVLFAGAGAVIGGSVAKIIVVRLSAVRVKLFFAIWVMLVGITSMPIFT